MHIWIPIYIASVAQSIFYLFYELKSQADFLRPSTVFSLTLLVWFYPKIPDLARISVEMGNWDIDRFLTFWLICQTVFYLTSRLQSREIFLSSVEKPKKTKEAPWFIFTFLCFLIGGGCFFLLNRLPSEMLYMRQPSGIITIYIFFSGFLTISLFCATFLACSYKGKRRKFYYLPIIFSLVLYADRILIHGKRSELTELLFFAAVFWMLALGKKVPRILLITSVLLVFVFNAVVSDYRGIAKGESRDFSQISDIPVIERVSESFLRADHDIVNALATVESKSRPSQYVDLGANHWNRIVFAYFPSQIFGKDAKKNLMIETGSAISEELGYVPPAGTTTFLAGGLFQDFGWLGFLPMYFYAVVMKQLYLEARAKDLSGLILYSYYGALIPIVIIFGLTRFTTSFAFWAIVFYVVNRISLSKKANQKYLPRRHSLL